MTPPGPWLLALLNGAVLVAVLAVAVVVLGGRSADRVVEGTAWAEESRELARAVRRATEDMGAPADPDRVARRLLPLAGRIRGHVRTAPSTVDSGTYRRLYELGMACQAVAVAPRRAPGVAGGPFLEDRLARLRREARTLEDAVEGR